MDDTNNKEILRTFFDGKIGCIEYSDKWLPQLEEFCEVAKSLGYINNESPEAMKVKQQQKKQLQAQLKKITTDYKQQSAQLKTQIASIK